MYSYTENILKNAKSSITKPDDFGYWGSEDMFKTWGFAGFDYYKGCKVLEKSNFKFISDDLMKRFPDDFRIETYRHWVVGHIDRLVCRVLHSDSEITEQNITDAFRAAMEWQDNLGEYPVADEGHYSDMQYEYALEMITFWSEINPRIIYKDNLNLESWQSRIYEKLVRMECYFDGDGEMSPSDDEFMTAIYELGLCNAEGMEEWYEWCDNNNLARPEFTLSEISRVNPNQLKLFED